MTRSRGRVLGPPRPHPRCRVCSGAPPALFDDPCAFCNRGRARFVCRDCGEALPLCPCFREHRVASQE
jgi:hypothetical protein